MINFETTLCGRPRDYLPIARRTNQVLAVSILTTNGTKSSTQQFIYLFSYKGILVMNPLSVVMRALFWRSLQRKGPALTFVRLCTSRHLQDLQWIASFVLLLFGWVIYVRFQYDGAVTALFGDDKVVAVVAGASAAVLNWTYQSGSRRIGAVDLFAREISVLCTIFIVVDYAHMSVARAKTLEKVRQCSEHGPTAAQSPLDARIQHDLARKFTSEEQYTPVYDNHVSELEHLDVGVVTYVTQFYLYRKTMVDYLRAISEESDINRQSELLNNMIYMQFLMYESARLAAGELIEFEPNRAESLVNILCSELVAYAFLAQGHKDDYKGARLHLRMKQYQTVVPQLYEQILNSKHDSWIRARTSAPEMLTRYMEMCSELAVKPDSLLQKSFTANMQSLDAKLLPGENG
jgi:hypothetical protein